MYQPHSSNLYQAPPKRPSNDSLDEQTMDWLALDYEYLTRYPEVSQVPAKTAVGDSPEPETEPVRKSEEES